MDSPQNGGFSDGNYNRSHGAYQLKLSYAPTGQSVSRRSLIDGQTPDTPPLLSLPEENSFGVGYISSSTVLLQSRTVVNCFRNRPVQKLTSLLIFPCRRRQSLTNILME